MSKVETVAYGQSPELMGKVHFFDDVSKYYLYLPIKMKGEKDIRVPKALRGYTGLLERIFKLEGLRQIQDKYVYLSVEVGPVKIGITQKRAGWHSDGFMSDDINYVWTNCCPTEFGVYPFVVKQDHQFSMEQFEEQIEGKDQHRRRYDDMELIRMDQFNIHRASIPTENHHCRMFVKVSISDHKYNLRGNSHNELFEYKWAMYDRTKVRNHPTLKEADFIEKCFGSEELLGN